MIISMKRIIFSGAVMVIFSLGLSGVANAQSMTSAQLQAQIASLTTELQSLEQQLAAQGGNTATWCYTFDSNISVGMGGPAVTALQTALQKDGETVTVNGSFDDQTASAVSGFQEKYAGTILTPSGLQYGTGYVGAKTRAELNSLYGCGTSPNVPLGYNPGGPIIGVQSSTSVPPLAPTPMPVPVATPPVMAYPVPSPMPVTNPSSITVTSPSAGQSFALGSTIDFQWTPAAGGVAAIELVPANNPSSPYGFIYSMKVNSDPVDYNGATTYTLPSFGLTPGPYYAVFYNPEPYAGSNQGPGTVIGQSSVFTITGQAPTITNVTSAGATPTPGSNEMLGGTNLPVQNARIIIDPSSTSALVITPSYYNAGGGGSMTFFLPSSVSVGSHTIEVQSGSITSNQFTFMVVSSH